jgi:hypothetical protein
VRTELTARTRAGALHYTAQTVELEQPITKHTNKQAIISHHAFPLRLDVSRHSRFDYCGLADLHGRLCHDRSEDEDALVHAPRALSVDLPTRACSVSKNERRIATYFGKSACSGRNERDDNYYDRATHSTARCFCLLCFVCSSSRSSDRRRTQGDVPSLSTAEEDNIRDAYLTEKLQAYTQVRSFVHISAIIVLESLTYRSS